MESRKYLLFDVETNGLPVKRYSSLKNYDNWPRVVQIAWGIYEENGKLLKIKDYIIKPNNFTITKESEKIHRISHEYAFKNGSDIKTVLSEFICDLSSVEYIIAHNLDFDYKVISCEINRLNLKSNINNLKKICTMQCSTDFCKLGEQKNNKYKWPKLSELYYKIFNEIPEGVHNALVDIEICNACLKELIKKDIISL